MSRRSGHLQAILALWAATAVLPDARAVTTVQVQRTAPYHPTLITAEYKGKTLPVVEGSAEFAEVEVDGKLQRLYGIPHYAAARAPAYAPGFIHFKAQTANSVTTYQGIQRDETYFPDQIVSKKGDYQCTIVTDTPQEDCYLVVFFYRLDAAGRLVPGQQFAAFRGIGALAAGQARTIKINAAYIGHPGEIYYFAPMIFTHGREIRTDQSPLLDQFFRGQEMADHATFLERYGQRFPSTDHAPVPYLRVALTLPPGADAKALPPGLKARFTITDNGEVEGIVFVPALDDKLAAWVTRDLQGWLFLPRLALGSPVATVVDLPLSFP